MLYEYAVEPRAIGTNWETFRYVIEKFGFDKGRLISEYPKRWLREVYDATVGLPPMQKKRIEEALNQAKKNKLIRCHRLYDGDAGNWLYNALQEHSRLPFHAIIASENSNGDDVVLPVGEIDDLHPLFSVSPDFAVAREAISIAGALSPFLLYSDSILFVDPFFDFFNDRYKRTLRECLEIVNKQNNAAHCEVHYRYHENKVDPNDLAGHAPRLFEKIVPEGMTIQIFCWKEISGGADFHARYLLTNKGGVAIDAGFSAEGNHQTTDMHLLDFSFAAKRREMFDRKADDYELVEPVLQIASNGYVEHV